MFYRATSIEETILTNTDWLRTPIDFAELNSGIALRSRAAASCQRVRLKKPRVTTLTFGALSYRNAKNAHVPALYTRDPPSKIEAPQLQP